MCFALNKQLRFVRLASGLGLFGFGRLESGMGQPGAIDSSVVSSAKNKNKKVVAAPHKLHTSV